MAESKKAGEILESVVEDGRHELDRASAGLTLSGLAALISRAEILDAAAFELLLEKVSDKLEPGFWTVALKAVFGGWIVALMAWLVAACRDTISQIFFVYILAFLIPAGELTHVIAGSAEVLVSVFAGETALSEYLGGFLLPTLAGNIVGGLILVTLLNYGQVMGSRKHASAAESAQEEGSTEE